MMSSAPAPVLTPAPAVQMLPCADIQMAEAIQPRERLDTGITRTYTENWEDAEPGQDPFPPIDVFAVQDAYYVADGFHRLAAARQAGRDMIRCRVHQGTMRDAMIFAIFANVRRGLRYQGGDVTRILERLLRDPEYAQVKDRPLADQVGVSHVYVWT